MTFSALEVSKVFHDAESTIHSCNYDFRTTSLETLNQKAWQIGQSLLAIEKTMRDAPELQQRYELLSDDFQALTVRISIALRKQGRPALQPARATPWMKFQALGEKARAWLVKKEQIETLTEAARTRQPKNPPRLDADSLGTKEFTQKVEDRVEIRDALGGQVSNVLKQKLLAKLRGPTLDGLYTDILHRTCATKDDWRLASHLPNRTLTAEDVRKIPVRDLIHLPSEQFIGIMDLISGAQAMQMYRTFYYRNMFPDPSPFARSPDRTHGVFIFNKHFAERFARVQRSLYTAPVHPRIIQAADLAWKRYQNSVSPERFVDLEKQPKFQKLLDAMMTPSETLQGKIPHNRDNWLQLCKKYMAKGLQQKVTPQFLVELNSAIRQAQATTTDPSDVLDEQEGHLGFRTRLRELLSPPDDMYYLPQCMIEREIDAFCTWINAEIEACDRGERNPILVAASACQRLVSIHGFSNGNGRTSRFLSDLILRRYGILPCSWKIEQIPVFPLRHPHKFRATPTVAVERMLEGLENSYAIITK